MTTRRWMAIVAIVATLLALTIGVHRAKQTRDTYLIRAAYHAWREVRFRNWPARARDFVTRQLWEVQLEPLVEYHARLARKCSDAASRPWLPVEPDPPEPK
jgi:hypothetical protein